MDPEIAKIYGNKVRIRVCGLCWQNNNLLLVNHKSLKSGGFWSPPGGGVQFGESLELCLQREFMEETGLQVEAGQFLFGCEFINPPLHAIELFFEAFVVSGDLKRGQDPELAIIEEVKFFSEDQIREMPPGQLHGIFQMAKNAAEIKKLQGFYRI